MATTPTRTGIGTTFLQNARREAERRGLYDFPIVDVDAHHYEWINWRDVVRYIDHPSVRMRAEHTIGGGGAGSGYSFLPVGIGNQMLSGRIFRRGAGTGGPIDGALHDVSMYRAIMDEMAIDYSVVFPTVMLNLGLHPETDVEVAMARAYARWITEDVLPHERRILTMLYLPFNDPEASLRLVEEFGARKGVVGFMVTSLRYQPVHSNRYAKIYATLEEMGKPLAFHSIYNWGERSLEQLNRFLSVHALGFPLYNMVHLTNIVINGIPERFPKLKFVWMEAGLAWIPFLMLRLDNEYMMRPSEAPQLKRRPSEYMQDFFYSSQPMERCENLALMASTFEQIRAETQLLYSSDYPHWDFDLPTRIYDLPFLSEQAKRRILGGNALRLFGLEQP